MVTDFLVIGSGIAGLSAALKLSELGRVILISKSSINEGSTRYAQGGIASVFDKTDSFEQHIEDTLRTGDGLCNTEAVKLTVTEGPARVRELIEYGVPFEKRKSTSETSFEYDLALEGGHRAHRILHATDFTGQAIIETLVEQVKSRPTIEILEHVVGIDLITTKSVALRLKPKSPDTVIEQTISEQEPNSCLGAYILNTKTSEIHSIAAQFTVLATGGAGKAYLYTTNPDTATGDGIAMAYRAGARVENMEFMQFHPTCLYLANAKTEDDPRAKSFLISEALRGEGGILRDKLGNAFMKSYHPMADLASRDIVARAIDAEMKKQGLECVYLDMTAVEKTKNSKILLRERFPNIFEYCLRFGIDMTKDWIPVVPAAHYTCGGIATNLDARTSIDRLFAIGEAASTGLHGANRLASNSLLEACVFAERAFMNIKNEFLKLKKSSVQQRDVPHHLPEWDSGMAVPMEEMINIHHTWRELRTLMWNYVGIVRSNKRLERAKARLELIKNEVQEYYWQYILTSELLELRNLVLIADLIIQSAIQRKESRGLHYNTDFPSHDDSFFLKNTIL